MFAFSEEVKMYFLLRHSVPFNEHLNDIILFNE
jgi:hypothetical protein